MKTALIIHKDSQHVILQADCSQEGKVLDMMNRRHTVVEVEDCNLRINDEGELYDTRRANVQHRTAIVIKVLPAPPVDTEVITMTKNEYRMVKRYELIGPSKPNEIDDVDWLLERLVHIRKPSRFENQVQP